MKKLLLVLVVAILAIALVACGGDDDTTAETTTTASGTTTEAVGGTTTEAVDDTTTEAVDDTTEDVTDTTAEETDYAYGDLIWDPDCMALNMLDSVNFCWFEDTHASLDNNVALILNFSDYGGVYIDLFLIDPDNADNNTNWEPNLDYTWVVTVDGVEYPVSRFSLFNNGTSGWVRADLGPDFKYSNYAYDENNQYGYDIKLAIYDSSKNVVYHAYLTDPEYSGLYYHTKPADVVMLTDTTRNPAYVQVDQSLAEPLSGPDSGISEGYKQFFDGSLKTKICTSNNDESGTVVVKYTTPITIVGFSLVNANDNATSTGRTIVAFELYGSVDGDNWDLIYTADGTDGEGNAIDKGTISANYMERFYEVENSTAYSYFKFVPHNGEMWQCSELLFWTEG